MSSVWLKALNISCGIVTPYIMLLALEHFLPIRSKRWAKPLLYVGCCLLVGMIIYVGDRVNLPGALIPFALAVFVCCEGDRLQRLSITLIFASIGLSCNALMDSYFMSAAYCLPRLFVWFGVYFVLKRFAPKHEYNLPSRLWVLIDVLTLTPFAATLITVLLSDYIQGFLLLLVVTLSSFGLLWAVVVLARQQKLEQEKSFYEMNRVYYQNLEQQQFQVRRLRHDMANHLQAMSAMPEPGLREYLAGLLHSPAMEHTQKFCENSVVNIVLASKEAIMEENKISVDIKASLPHKLPVQDVDLCAVFANSLDNAIEACIKLPEDQRNISLKARTDKGLFVLQVQNPLCGKTVWQNGIPVTTKDNLEVHGFGLAGIREIAVRYGGSMEITTDETCFTLLVYLPIHQPTNI